MLATGSGAVVHADAVSASSLAGQMELTPESLIRSFAGFAFELSEQPQDADIFLQRKRGDCDDFASLASRLLTERGYKTKLVAVMMEQQTHIVCYVTEARGFLDFNHRADAHPIIKSDGSLADIAQKVAGDFRSRWQMASEFKYENKKPVYLDNVFPSLAPSNEAVVAAAPAMTQERPRTNDTALLRIISPAPAGPDHMAQRENPRLR